MKRIISALMILCMLMSVITLSVSADETNFVPEDVSGLETGVKEWTTLAGGTAMITDNPVGEGKVLCYTNIPDKTYASPQIDIRKYVQDNVKEPTKVYGSLDIFCPDTDLLNLLIRIRTKTKDGFSMCKADGQAFCMIGKLTGFEGEWTRASFSFEVTESDLASTEPWNLCFDGLSRMTQNKIFIDNLYLGLEEFCDIPENDDTGAENKVPAGEGENFIEPQNGTFEEGTHDWKAINNVGEISVVSNPSGEGKVLKYTVTENAQNYHSPQLDIRGAVRKNLTEENVIYGSIDIYSDIEIKTLIFRIRTQTPQGFSLCENDDKNFCTIKTAAVSAGKWTTVIFPIEITDTDMASNESWNFCFDGLANGRTEFTAYFDNFYLGLEEPEEKEDIRAEIPEKTPVTRQENTLIGTIRWDAFTASTPDGKDPASQVARVLSPKKYHSQAPFFSTVNEDGTIAFPEYTVETWEKEAEYAVAGGLDYFAYLWYETEDKMSDPRKLHLQSEKKDIIKFCAILEKIRSESTMNEIFDAMKDSCYLTLDGRPVIFLYGLSSDNWTPSAIKKLRQAAANAGIEKSLYIVGMLYSKHLLVFNENLSKDIDAISWYGVGATETGQSYESLAKDCEETMKLIGGFTLGNNKDIIPSFTTGRDTRARIETGVSWVDGDPNAKDDLLKPYKNKYALAPTMQELEDHIFNVLTYTQTSPNAMTNIVCSYGWNEHEEGGWLCPTITVDENGDPVYNEDGTIKANTERLDALKRAIDRVRAGDSAPSASSDPSASPDITPAGGNNTNNGGGFNILYVIIPAVAVIIIAGVIVTVLVIKKKKADKTEE